MALVGFAIAVSAGAEAAAVVGNPFTPFSWAGSARRSARRATWSASGPGQQAAARRNDDTDLDLPPGCRAGEPCAARAYDAYFTGPEVTRDPW